MCGLVDDVVLIGFITVESTTNYSLTRMQEEPDLISRVPRIGCMSGQDGEEKEQALCLFFVRNSEAKISLSEQWLQCLVPGIALLSRVCQSCACSISQEMRARAFTDSASMAVVAGSVGQCERSSGCLKW